MTPLVVDASAYSAFKRGHAGALDAFRTAPTILVPTIVLGELLGGFEAGLRREANRSQLDAFLDSSRVHIVSIGAATAERYAVVYAHLRAAKQLIPTNDLWIAASAMEHAAELLTLDRHFQRVPQILVRYLPL